MAATKIDESNQQISGNGILYPWTTGRVPIGYWDHTKHRMNYLKWLGKQLGYRKPEHWYQVCKQDFHGNFGGGMLANYYRDSPQEALRDYLPDYPWKGWLFRSTSQGFWKSKKNRMEYMDWLGEQLGLESKQDWYRISRSDFHTHRGGGLLANYYGDSVFRALKEYIPRERWILWKFKTVPQGFWQDPKNRRKYLKWLGDQLGFEKPSDYYRLTRKDFVENHGEALLMTYYNGSIFQALKEFRPSYKWSKDKYQEAR